jgi:signal transduction histidine kinase
MDSMGDIVWSIHSQEADFESVLARMRQFASELCEPLNIDFRFNIAAGAERISFSPQKRKCVFLLFKEAINNAAKYSNCTMLTIDCKLSGNNFEMEIKDNGKGFDEETVKKGNGLKNMRERAEKNLKGEIAIHSSIGNGTTIVLRCLV